MGPSARTDRRAGIVNGERATVVAIDAEQGRILPDKADRTHLAQRLDGPLYLDAPASSVTNNESAYCVAISRATHEAKISTGDALRLPEVLGREDGKTAALEVQANATCPGCSSSPPGTALQSSSEPARWRSRRGAPAREHRSLIAR